MSTRPPPRRWSVPIGRLMGIQLRVHVTFVLIVALVWVGSSGPGGMGVPAAMLWLALIFACVTVHELSHSVVARNRGVGVRAIVLLPIGGVSELEAIPDRPRDELAVAAAGPLASLGIALLSALTAALAGLSLWPVDLVHDPLLARLAWFNLLVGAFNLLPAFPLDGGRVLRALLERRMSLELATRHAARAGRALAGLMVAVGIFVNPWLVVIGVFVWSGATAEEAATVVHARLGGRRVRDVMVPTPWGALPHPELPRLAPDDPLEQVALLAFRDSGAETLPVVVDGRLVGQVRAQDVARLLERPEAA